MSLNNLIFTKTPRILLKTERVQQDQKVVKNIIIDFTLSPIITKSVKNLTQ